MEKKTCKVKHPDKDNEQISFEANISLTIFLNPKPLEFILSSASKLRITQKCSSKKTEIAINQSETAIKCPDRPEKNTLPNLGLNKCMHLLKAIKATIIQSA